jgi:hypothetical protein
MKIDQEPLKMLCCMGASEADTSSYFQYFELPMRFVYLYRIGPTIHLKWSMPMLAIFAVLLHLVCRLGSKPVRSFAICTSAFAQW